MITNIENIQESSDQLIIINLKHLAMLLATKNEQKSTVFLDISNNYNV